MAEGPLTPFRILDLTDVEGQYCTKLLADLGAEVIKVEPPDGAQARRIGPFKGEVPHPERSLFFLYYNTNKKSITLDLAKAPGQALFKRLVAQADALVESFAPGYLTSLGLGYETLQGVNQSLVMTSITGFGQWGPRKDYKATNLVVFASSGLMLGIGEPDGPPTGPPGNMGFDLACVDAAIGTLLALWQRMLTGEGQYVEVSAQEVLAAQIGPRQPLPSRRSGNLHVGLAPSGVYRCRDGEVEFTIVMPGHWENLIAFLGNPPELEGPQWENREFRRDHALEIAAVINDRIKDMGQQEVMERSQQMHIPCLPVNTAGSFTDDPHIRARGFFVPVTHPEMGDHIVPGAPYRMDKGGWAIHHSAPLLGQHNEEIYGRMLGLSRQELAALQGEGVL